MNGSASRPSSATMKGTRWAISPETNATSRESRSSLETMTLHLALRAAANAAASWGRRSSASAPFPDSATEAGTVPTHEGLGLDDRDCPQGRGKPTIQLDQEQAITVRELDATSYFPP